MYSMVFRRRDSRVLRLGRRARGLSVRLWVASMRVRVLGPILVVVMVAFASERAPTSSACMRFRTVFPAPLPKSLVSSCTLLVPLLRRWAWCQTTNTDQTQQSQARGVSPSHESLALEKGPSWSAAIPSWPWRCTMPVSVAICAVVVMVVMVGE